MSTSLHLSNNWCSLPAVSHWHTCDRIYENGQFRAEFEAFTTHRHQEPFGLYEPHHFYKRNPT